MGDFLNLVIDLRESSGRNEVGSTYVEIKHSRYFLRNKFHNTFSINTAENHKTHKYGEVSMEDVKHKPEIKIKTRGETEVFPIKHPTNMFQELIIKIQWVEVLGNTKRFQYNY